MQHHTGCSSDETENLKARIRQLESALKQQEMACETLKHYEKVFFHLKHEVHIWQLERNEHHGIKTWRLLDANPAALQNWGKQRSDVIGKLTDDIFSESNTPNPSSIAIKLGRGKLDTLIKAALVATEIINRSIPDANSTGQCVSSL